MNYKKCDECGKTWNVSKLRENNPIYIGPCCEFKVRAKAMIEKHKRNKRLKRKRGIY